MSDELTYADWIALGRVLKRFLTEDYDGMGSHYVEIYDHAACIEGWVALEPHEREVLRRVREMHPRHQPVRSLKPY